MSYVPLPLKDRPLTWADLVGQEVVVKTLMNALKDNRLVPSLLCAGSRGTGKTTTARILARTLNCQARQGVEPCLKCESCQSIGDENSFAVQEMDAASHGLVDDVRRIKEEVNYVSIEGGAKVYIIDECHSLTKQAWQAFLKLLEEPPAGVYFVFCTTEAHMVPDTIISRSLVFNFKRITTQDIINRLKFVASSENIACEDLAIRQIALQARGGMRDALTLLDQAATFAQGGAVTDTLVQQLLHACSPERLFGLFDALVQKDLKRVYDQLSAMYAEAPDMSIVVQDLADLYRQMMLARLGIKLEDATPEFEERCRQEAAKVVLEYLVEAQTQLHFISDQLRRSNMLPRHVLEVYMPRLLYGGLATGTVASPQPTPVVRPVPPQVLTPQQVAEALKGHVLA